MELAGSVVVVWKDESRDIPLCWVVMEGRARGFVGLLIGVGPWPLRGGGCPPPPPPGGCQEDEVGIINLQSAKECARFYWCLLLN